jgi:hypothetical protein
MACKQCSSDRLSRFNAEMNLHFPRWEGLDKPTVWVFPEVVVCLACGFAEFVVPEAELFSLGDGTTARKFNAPSHQE